jgi:type 1 glutamine amidotransferase
MSVIRRVSFAATLIAVTTLAAAADPATVKPIRALLVCGGCCHDYEMQKVILTEGIAARARVEWVVAHDPDTAKERLNPVYAKADWADGFDVVVHDECTSGVKDPAVINRILEPHRRGLPGVVLHCGMHSYRSEGWPNATPWFEFTGLASTGHGPQQPISITFVDKDSPITHGLADWTTINEEHYNNSAGKLLDTAHALARGKQTFKNRAGRETTNDFVVAWTNEYAGKAKVFATTLGHNNATVADPRYLDLVTRGLLWSCGKLNDQYLKPFDPAKTKFRWEEDIQKGLARPQTKEPPKAPPPGN